MNRLFVITILSLFNNFILYNRKYIVKYILSTSSLNSITLFKKILSIKIFAFKSTKYLLILLMATSKDNLLLLLLEFIFIFIV